MNSNWLSEIEAPLLLTCRPNSHACSQFRNSNCFEPYPPSKVGNLKGYLFWPPFLKVFCQKWKFGRAKEMSASAGIWTRVPRSKGSYAIQWATPLLIENQQKLASYNNFCFGPFLTKNFQKGNGQNRYIFELHTLVTRPAYCDHLLNIHFPKCGPNMTNLVENHAKLSQKWPKWGYQNLRKNLIFDLLIGTVEACIWSQNVPRHLRNLYSNSNCLK